MPKITHDIEKIYISKLKLVIARKRDDITISEATAAMADMGYKLDKDYVHKLIKKVRGARKYNMENQQLQKEVEKFEQLVEFSIETMLALMEEQDRVEKVGKEFVLVKGASRFEKLSALKAVIDAQKTLLNLKFDAGIFNRKLGDLKVSADLTPEQSELINMGLEKLYGVSRKNKTGEGESGDKKGVGKN